MTNQVLDVTEPGALPATNGISPTAQPNPLDAFIVALSADGGLWINGIDQNLPLQTDSPAEVISATFKTAAFVNGQVTNYTILETRMIHLEVGTYTAMLVDTNLGRMIILLQHLPARGAGPGEWWRRIYDAHLPLRRLT